jgi:hypothetical protein
MTPLTLTDLDPRVREVVEAAIEQERVWRTEATRMTDGVYIHATTVTECAAHYLVAAMKGEGDADR